MAEANKYAAGEWKKAHKPDRADLTARRASSQQALINRMQQAKDEGDLPPETDVEGITNYLLAILQGMSVQAGSGASKEQLQELVRTSVAMWPGK
jgi:hypothetical protein